jgi:hypothetical protein
MKAILAALGRDGFRRTLAAAIGPALRWCARGALAVPDLLARAAAKAERRAAPLPSQQPTKSGEPVTERRGEAPS